MERADEHLVRSPVSHRRGGLVVTESPRARWQRPAGYGKHLSAIRRFFLQPQERYTVAELARLWKVHPDDVRDVLHDELTRTSSPEPPIAWADAVGASVAFRMLRPLDIERALGLDFSRVRPDTWRTVSVVVHLPKFVTDAVANEPSLPADLPLELRLERALIELYVRHESRSGAPDATERRHQR